MLTNIHHAGTRDTFEKAKSRKKDSSIQVKRMHDDGRVNVNIYSFMFRLCCCCCFCSFRFFTSFISKMPVVGYGIRPTTHHSLVQGIQSYLCIPAGTSKPASLFHNPNRTAPHRIHIWKKAWPM